LIFAWFHQINAHITQFNDNELGISFDYPKDWGEILTVVEINSRELTKKISFTNQPNLFFEISSTALRSNAQNLQKIPTSNDGLPKFCRKNIKNYRSEPLSAENDIYRLNGTDVFGICPKDQGDIKAIAYQADKSITPKRPINEVVSKKDLHKGSRSSVLKFSKKHYLRTQNPLYDPLIIHQNGIPDTQSQNYCYTKWNIPSDPTAYLKKYKCISYNDKLLIENTFNEFDKSESNKQVELILNSLEMNNIENTSQYFIDHFSELKKYEDIEYSYYYPKVLVPNRWNKDENFNAVKTITRESIVKGDEEYKACEGPCIHPTLTALGWDNEKQLLKNSTSDGEIECAKGVNGSSLCEIKTVGENKFLIRYTGRFTGDSSINKTYIIYNNDLRFEIIAPELESQGTNPELFKGIENQLIQKVYEDIVKSFTFHEKSSK